MYTKEERSKETSIIFRKTKWKELILENREKMMGRLKKHLEHFHGIAVYLGQFCHFYGNI